jgi:hypothetical protein
MKTITFLACCALLACHRDRPEPPPRPPPAAKAPVRGAVGDQDLRVMLGDVASAKACEMIRGQFRGLRDAERPGVVTGVLWIRECTITNDGTHVRFAIAGNGWQWAQQEKREAGGKFDVHQYVKFGVHATIDGTLDLAYDRGAHVVSFWFTPARTPEIAFEPIGGVSVDRKGLWSSVIGALSSVFADSPDTQGEHEAKKQGTQQFTDQLADGLSVAIDLCSGYQRFTLGRPPKGSLGPPDVGETPRVPVELAPGALFVFGPELAPRGMTIDVDAPAGPVDVALACSDEAEQLADAFVHGKPVALAGSRGDAPEHRGVLAHGVVSGHGKLHAPPSSCKVAVVARAMTPGKSTLVWRRPAGEQARSTGGPVLHCAAPTPRPGATTARPNTARVR